MTARHLTRRTLGAALAWGLVAGVAGVSVATLRLSGDPLADFASLSACLGLVVAGAFIVQRRPGNLIGWLLVVAGSAGVGVIWSDRYVSLVQAASGEPPATAVWAAWFHLWGWGPFIGPLFVFLPLLFPNGRLPSPRWRLVVWVAVLQGGVQMLLWALRPGPMPWGPEAQLWPNPLGVEALGPYADPIIRASEIAFLPVFVGIVAAPVVRWRRSRGVERKQMQWFVAAVALLAAYTPLAWFDLVAEPLGSVIFSLVLLAVPAAIGVAVLRYRLYEIDRLVSRTVSYALLTALLASVYVTGVILLSRLFAPLGAGSELAVAAATLAAAAVFAPARRRIQNTVDRRFNRARYDAEQVVAAFRERLRDEVELEDVAAATRIAAVATVEPAQASLWLPWRKVAR